MRNVILFNLLFLFNFLHAADLLPGFVEIPVATGLDPTAMAQAPDGRIFITEKYGTVRIVENGVLLPDPFIQMAVDNFNERGLSGIALHPDFVQNGYVYLYYTVPMAGHNRLSRVQAVGNFALPGSEEVLLELDPLAGTIHNAGAMAFGPDGKLYLGTGDGGYGHQSALLTSLLGKVLRLNPDGTIPDDNPFYTETTGPYRAIYATGFRNPFSMTFQPGTGRMFVGDVGSVFFEEINEVLPGKDYGWSLLEGKRTNQVVPPNYKDPLYAYSHTIGCAVVGAAFYNPPVAKFPNSFVGKFFFGDYCNKSIRILDPNTGQLGNTFASNIDRPLAVLTGLDGALYYLARGGLGGGSEVDNTSSGNGVLWRVTYVGNGAPVFSIQPANVLVPVGEEAVFTAKANGTPTIQYQWQRDGEDIPGATGQELVFNMTALADSGALIRCYARNVFGQVVSQEAVLRVTENQRPVPEILTPTLGQTFAAGDTIWFTGRGIDPETGLLDADDLVWQIDFQHDQHAHPGLGPLEGVSSGYYVVPIVGETSDNVWLRIYLTARDPAGLRQTVYRNIFPRKTRIRLESTPSGLPMRIDGNTYTTPFEIVSVEGLAHQVQTSLVIPNQNTLTILDHWTDGDIQPDRIIYAKEPLTTLHAVYEEITYTGKGMYGLYYTFNPDTTFGNRVFTRLDTTVNFAWGLGSPDPRLPPDFFGVKWLGYVEPAFTAEYNFYVDTDDGFRLWVDGQLISEEWKPKGSWEIGSTIFLEKGRRYPIELHYFEWGGDALAKLSWSNPYRPKEVIPEWRLYPRLPENPGINNRKLQVQLRPNPVGNLLTLVFDTNYQESFDLRVIDAAGRMVREWRNQRVEIYQEQLNWPVGDLMAGTYWLELKREGGEPVVLGFVKL